MFDITKSQIDRIIIHRVHAKEEKTDEVRVVYEEGLFSFDKDEKIKLVERIQKAFSKENRAFKLSINNSSEESFYRYALQMKNSSEKIFIDRSKNIAQLLAASHTRKNIPGGILLVMDGYDNKKKHFVLVIKAELQEAFAIQELSGKKKVGLIRELFLSPAKDFYKIGVIVEDKNQGDPKPNDSYSCFMYDDHFDLQSKDLAEYFYNSFLGFTTSTNDKLTTKNFYDEVYKFITHHVENFDDQQGYYTALKTLIREDVSGIINPSEFGNKYFEGELKRQYDTTIVSKYTHAFTKDPQLLDNRLKRSKMNLGNDVKIEGPTELMQTLKVYTEINDKDVKKLMLGVEKKDIALFTLATKKPTN